MECPVCKRRRFYPCKKKTCIGKEESSCKHSIKSRTPMRRMHYFPLIPRLTKLIRSEIGREMVNCRAIPVADLDGSHDGSKTGILYDVMDGAACQDAMARMRTKFVSNPSCDDSTESFLLCLGVSYDGTQVCN